MYKRTGVRHIWIVSGSDSGMQSLLTEFPHHEAGVMPTEAE